MEGLKTLQKQELLAHVERAVEAYFIGRSIGGKRVETKFRKQAFIGELDEMLGCKT